MKLPVADSLYCPNVVDKRTAELVSFCRCLREDALHLLQYLFLMSFYNLSTLIVHLVFHLLSCSNAVYLVCCPMRC